MLYVYFGEDIGSARKKVQATVGSLLAKNPNALYFRITSDVLSRYDLTELTDSQGLFKSEYVVVLDSLMGLKENEELIISHLEQIATAVHPFFLLDTKLLAPVRKKLEKYAHKIYEFEHTTPQRSDSFNTFALTDALGEKDIKKLWTLFREAKQRGVSDEEIHGVLFWMCKSMLFAVSTNTPDEAGMKPYPYNKAKKFVRNFTSEAHLSQLVQNFALLPQYARRNGTVLEIELERFILGIT